MRRTSRTAAPAIEHTELLEATDGQRLDTRATSTASGIVRTWKPWDQSTGPRTDEGKARTARNGFKGAGWREMRELTKALNEVLREQREGLRRATR